MSSGLWAQFLNFTTERIVLHRIFGNQKFGHAEIDYYDIRIWLPGFEYEIFRLQITVSNPKSMAIVHRKQHLSEEFGGILFREALFVFYFVKKVSAPINLSDEVNVIIILEILKKFEHVRMIELDENIDFKPELFLVLDLSLGNYFDCSYKAKFAMVTLVHGTVCASALLKIGYFVDISHIFFIF